MKRTLPVAALAMAMLMPAKAFAQTPADTIKIEYKTLIDKLVLGSPEIKSLLAGNEAEYQSSLGENALAGPEAEFEHQWGAKNVGNKWSVGVNQTFDWPGVYAARKKAADALLEVSDASKKALIVDIKLRIKAMLTELIYINRNLALLRDIEENFDKIEGDLQKSLRAREATILDIKKIQFERSNNMSSIDELLTRRAELLADIRSLSGDKYFDFPLEATGYWHEQMLYDDEYEQIYTNSAYNPILEASEAQLKAATIQVSAGSRSSLPGFSVGAMYLNELGDKFGGFKVGVNLPQWGKKRRKLAAKAEETLRANQLAMAEAEQEQAWRASIRKIKILDNRRGAYEKLFENDDFIRLLTKSLSAGQLSVLDYLAEFNYYLGARQDYEKVVYSRQIEAVSLNRYSSEL